ncbi:unnamed protein product [Vitrella brassicaformis CCMP3155]|uniref:Uncharacterized protein n=2 Tax=Vitrella brassicaformis TaxID=1169539 RepID=A0A0G4FQJ9_VITBC|nr:unnamed protein product [Vitrella brassicaformis CCMP3155]|eukprot:CEM16718.1 unnamed protein product [Vitrella brassicaformis CCMP3155]
MNDRVVGLFDGHFVYEDGHGGYEMDVKGERRAILPAFHPQIKLCFSDPKNSSSSKANQECSDTPKIPRGASGESVPYRSRVTSSSPSPVAPPPPPAMAAPPPPPPAMAAMRPKVSIELTDPGVQHQVVQQGAGRQPAADDRVTFDVTMWEDKIHGSQKTVECHGVTCAVTDELLCDWQRETVLLMSAGEVRHLTVPSEVQEWVLQDKRMGYGEMRLVAIHADN